MGWGKKLYDSCKDCYNVPGSSGCIVLKNQEGWQRLCDRLATIANQGVKSLPLTVKYA
ncbi:MAG: hypothetical protein QQW96_11705 [Tychonema bourrellyi B0820]|uniref:hypothetical protein n=1 Tax=Tychonema bourrellyi TaxID=54313 RepID=UPI0015D51A96|nr:hypothetical protein [Tychonema bourrellyi]MDQ2098301.1 hypothetical protein [Tychonema bourrellyi B0820]